MANPNCFRLLLHFMRAAASRTFCTAGSSSPIRIAIIAITTRSSIRVNPNRLPYRDRMPERDFIRDPQVEKKEWYRLPKKESFSEYNLPDCQWEEEKSSASRIFPTTPKTPGG